MIEWIPRPVLTLVLGRIAYFKVCKYSKVRTKHGSIFYQQLCIMSSMSRIQYMYFSKYVKYGHRFTRLTRRSYQS